MAIKRLYIIFLLVSSKILSSHLFENYKELKGKIAHVQIANLPTPINKFSKLNNIFIKRDDLAGYENLYGGNKVRKLEFLLADALKQGVKQIITWGCVGSNHAVATACYSKQLGLNCFLMLLNQSNSPVVKQNLLLDYYFGSTMQLYDNNKQRVEALEIILASNKDTYFIPTGGSVPLGCLGYVNAALELKWQIDNGIMPEPDYIYLPVGSCGTTAGLLLGLKLAKIKSKIIAVTVYPQSIKHFSDNIEKLFVATNKLLNDLSKDISVFEFSKEQLIINKDFCGVSYGVITPEAQEAMLLMKSDEDINLEGTYSAKAFAALIADVKNNYINKSSIVLFWNTYCGLDFSKFTSDIDYKNLPAKLHKYFN